MDMASFLIHFVERSIIFFLSFTHSHQPLTHFPLSLTHSSIPPPKQKNQLLKNLSSSNWLSII